MPKLTKQQRRDHGAACALLEKESLTFDEKWFIYENWNEGAENDVARTGAFFTPPLLARDFALDVGGSRVVDLCAGIGALSFAYYHRATYGNTDRKIDITCIEINPRFVEVGKKLLPEATWICADIMDVWEDLGRFDAAISNPPFGRVGSWSKPAPHYTGKDFELRVIDVAAELANWGTFIVPQGSAPFRFSGVQCYEERESRKYQKFTEQTGIALGAGCGVDTSMYRDAWKHTKQVCEIVTCDFSEGRDLEELETEEVAPQPEQLEIFGAVA